MNYYEILGVDEKATQEQIKTSYRTLVKKYHPDVNDAPNASAFFRLIQKAYETLGNPTNREKYDEYIEHCTNNDNFEYENDKEDNNDGCGENYSTYVDPIREKTRWCEEMLHEHGRQVEWYNTYIKFRFQKYNPFIKFLLISSRIILAPLLPVLKIVWGIFILLTAVSKVLSWIIAIGSIAGLGYMAIHDKFAYSGEWLLGLCTLGAGIAAYWLPHILEWLADKLEYAIDNFKQFISQIGILLFKKVPEGWSPDNEGFI